MTRQTIAAIILCAGAAIGLTTPAHAGDILAFTNSYDSPGYDYAPDTTPPAGPQLIGTFTFTPVVPDTVLGITISGSFGNGDSPTTALSDYYLGYGGDEEAVEIETCDSYSADCASNFDDGPTNWNLTLTPTEITALAPALAAGSIDFNYTWDPSPPAEAIPDFTGLYPDGFSPQYVYAGAATLDITPSPEPATVLFCFSGLAGLAAFRRFRKL